MTTSIIDHITEINKYYAVAGCIFLFILYLWDKGMVKRIFRWAFTLTTVAAIALLVQLVLDGGWPLSQGEQQIQAQNREPLVRSTYYRDPVAENQDLPDK
jgi:MFS superfamily sulfate permease-like transporter